MVVVVKLQSIGRKKTWWGPTMQYQRASGAQRWYKSMDWRAIGEGGVVNKLHNEGALKWKV